MNTDELAMMSGTKAYKPLPAFTLYPELSLKKNGKFYVTEYNPETKARDDREATANETKGTIVKIRRKIMRFTGGTLDLSSHEYDTADAPITLSDGTTRTEKEAKEDGAKVWRVLYFYATTGQVFKVAVSGHSLYNPDSTDLRLLNYLQEFADNEYSFQYMTEIYATSETEGEVTWYNMAFRRHEKHAEEPLKLVAYKIKEVYEQCIDQDKQNAKRTPYSQTNRPAPTQTIPQTTPPTSTAQRQGVKYPTEEVNPDDIPF